MKTISVFNDKSVHHAKISLHLCDLWDTRSFTIESSTSFCLWYLS